MKHILLFLLFLPLQFFAQVQPDRILPDYTVRSEKIRSVKATTLFIAARDNKPDTGVVAMEEYDKKGNIIHSDYHNTLDKNNFKSRTEYSYKADQRRVTVHYENGLVTDSTVFTSPAYYINYYPQTKRYVIHEIKDSILTETAISGTDTVVHKNKIKAPEKNSYGNDLYPNVYAKEISIYDSINKIDSTNFLDKKGEQILSIVNHYDNSHHLIKSDYYNRKDKNYRIYSACYNSKMNMTFYMPADKTSRTYQVIYEYDGKGMVVTEKRISSRKGDPVIVINYEYSYY
jgi:hypothetical protein